MPAVYPDVSINDLVIIHEGQRPGGAIAIRVLGIIAGFAMAVVGLVLTLSKRRSQDMYYDPYNQYDQYYQRQPQGNAQYPGYGGYTGQQGAPQPPPNYPPPSQEPVPSKDDFSR